MDQPYQQQQHKTTTTTTTSYNNDEKSRNIKVRSREEMSEIFEEVDHDSKKLKQDINIFFDAIEELRSISEKQRLEKLKVKFDSNKQKKEIRNSKILSTRQNDKKKVEEFINKFENLNLDEYFMIGKNNKNNFIK